MALKVFSRLRRNGRAGSDKEDAVAATGPTDLAGGNTDIDDEKTGENDAPLAPTATAQSELPEYPQGAKLAILMTSIFISMFLVALDRLIIATAIPQITNDFNSITDIGWYGSAYLLTTCAFQLMYGKLYTFFSIKLVFLTAVFLFEAGSAICGAAPNSVVFIVGRAIAGLGGAGIFSGVIVILVYAVPLHKRPLYQGLFGAIFGVASVAGPLLGGAFTTKVTWRWCFYINLPFGGVAMAIIFFFLPIPDRDTTHVPLFEKLKQLDFAGTSVLLPGVICLILALQWGGVDYAWSDGRIIALLTLGGALLLSFVIIQVLMPKTATVPPHIFMQRSIMAGVWITMFVGSSMMIFVYFLPVWFQAIMGASAVDSGIKMLPLMLAMVVASGMSGALTARVGYYTPFMLFGICLMSIGAGLLTTLQVDTEQAKWVGYQFLYGWGLGMTFQAPNLAAQTVLPNRDVPVGTSLMFFTQLLGGAIFISVGQNVLNGELLKRLSFLPGFSPEALKNTGATSLTHLPPEVRGPVLAAYNESLRVVFRVALILTCLMIVGAVFLEWRSVKKNKPGKAAAAADPEKGMAEGAAAGAGAEKEAPKDAAGTDIDGMTTDGEDAAVKGGEKGDEKSRTPGPAGTPAAAAAATTTTTAAEKTEKV